MALNYEVKINKVRVKKDLEGLKNVITRVFYTVIAKANDGYSKHLMFELEFDAADPLNFIDISRITEPMLVQWIKNHERFMPMPENIIEDMIEFDRKKEFIEDYQFDFLYNPPQHVFM